MRLVFATSRRYVDPADIYERIYTKLPVIVVMWHGQHFLTPLIMPKGWRVSVIISRSLDGETYAQTARKLGLEVIRASGSQKGHQIVKRRGVPGFLEALRCLREGSIVAATADIPPGPRRKAKIGIVKLAQYSGAPIIPLAVATNWHIDLNTWDRASINLPFGRLCFAAGAPIAVARNASDEALEAARCALQAELNETTARAYRIAKHGHG